MKNLSDVKTFFQIFNYKLTYNYYTHNFSYMQIPYSLRSISDLEKAAPQKCRREKG
jgi:hypothetical protein